MKKCLLDTILFFNGTKLGHKLNVEFRTFCDLP